MNRSFSLSFLTIQEASAVEAVNIAAQAGYDFVGLRLLPAAAGEPHYPIYDDASVLKEVQAALKDTGIKVSDVEIVRLKDNYADETFKPFLERAQALGAAHILVAGDDTDTGRLKDHYAQFCALAASHQLTADLEFMPWTAVKNLAQAREIVEYSQADNAGILIDALHPARSNSALVEVTALPNQYIHYIQLCDALAQYDASDEGLMSVARTGRLLPGNGQLDLLGLVQAIDPSKTIGLEIPNAQLLQQYSALERAQMAIHQARMLLTESTIGAS